MITDQKTVEISFIVLNFRKLWKKIKIKTHIPEKQILLSFICMYNWHFKKKICVTLQSQC